MPPEAFMFDKTDLITVEALLLLSQIHYFLVPTDLHQNIIGKPTDDIYRKTYITNEDNNIICVCSMNNILLIFMRHIFFSVYA